MQAADGEDVLLGHSFRGVSGMTLMAMDTVGDILRDEVDCEPGSFSIITIDIGHVCCLHSIFGMSGMLIDHMFFRYRPTSSGSHPAHLTLLTSLE